MDLRVLVLELRDELLRLLLVLALFLVVPARKSIVLRFGGLAVLVGLAHRVVLHLVGRRDALSGAPGGGVSTLRDMGDQIGAGLLRLEVSAELVQLSFDVLEGLLHRGLELLRPFRFRGALGLLQVPGSDGGLQRLLQHLFRRLQHFLLDLLQQPVDGRGDLLLHLRGGVLELLLRFVPRFREELLGVLPGGLRILQPAALYLRDRLLRALECSQRLAQR